MSKSGKFLFSRAPGTSKTSRYGIPLNIPASKPSELISYSAEKSGYIVPPINTFIREYVDSQDDILKFKFLQSDFTAEYNIFIDKFTPLFKGINKFIGDSERAIFTENAGGKSEISEAFSIYYLTECYRAKNILLEMEIEYWCDYKMVDFICTIHGYRVGVSVTRAMGYPSPKKFEYKDAEELINKKLYGLIVARNGIIKEQRFYKSILHIWCQTFKIAYLVKKAFSNLENCHNSCGFGLNVKTDIMVFLTVCDRKDIYSNKIYYERV